nr:hypothetical protein [Acidobacteriota bacterium]
MHRTNQASGADPVARPSRSTPVPVRLPREPRPPAGAPALDLAAIKARQQATWASGDFGQIGVRLQLVGETLCEAVDLRATDTVLDVAAGNGNASL